MAGAPQDRQQYNEAFIEVLQQLNPAQREAVEQIEGPVLAIAGPGTGKTHILSARIGRILLETDTQAQNILCLTFTDAGVNAMRQRLLQFIGPEAHRVHIYTFHSFCNSIIQDNLELFGSQDMEPLSELERVEIIRQILDELEARHPLRRGRNDSYFYESHLQGLFQMMKAEDWGPGHVHQAIDHYLASLPEREEFIYKINRGHIRKGDLKQAQIEEAQARMERLRAAADLFPRYQQAMARLRRYDYDDMILWVLEAFQQHEALLRNYQEQYLYFLIDEYQDTNGAQNEIIRQLIGYWDTPNIFIVGDDDQSIYEFQGARLKNLTDFYADYQDNLRLVLLQDNYRSSQHILDAARALIGHNRLRIVNQLAALGLDKLLIARSADFAQSPLRPEVRAYPNPLHEEADIAGQLRALQQAGFPLREVAVLYAKHRQAEGLIALLEKYGIPYSTKRRINILDLPLILNLREMLEYFAAELHQPHSGAPILFRILHFSFFGLGPNDLARLSHHLARQAPDEHLPWREALADASLWQQLGLEDTQSLRRFADFHDHILRHYASLSAPALVERLINRSGLLKYVLEHEEKNWLLQVLNTFLDFTRQEAARNPRLSIRRLLDILRSMDANRISLAVNKVLETGEGVQLLTAHSAKGLEFQSVFLLDGNSNHWEPGNNNGAYRFTLPDTLTFSGEEDALEARRRLFYVAVTRAKERLHLSYSEENSQGKPQRRAIFVDELLEGAGLEAQPKAVPAEALLEAEALRLTELEAPSIPAQEKVLVDSLLEGFQLSISALNRYLRCPLSFYYDMVLRAPELMSEAAHYGTAMHYALQRLFERMKGSKDKAFPSEEAFVRFFEQEMARRRAHFSRQEYERRLEMGRHNLPDYYRQHCRHWHKDVLLEYRPRLVEIDGVPLTGSIDKLEFLDAATARIVDYKSGGHGDHKLRRPTPANPLGGTYWRQLVFYKILYEAHPANTRRAHSGAISYLDPDQRGKFVEKELDYTAEDVQAVQQMIRDTYAKIMAHDFYTGCGEANCAWCNFVRHNELANSFSEAEVEELDD
jgi:DNA helicase II / ATP-dependent DNA helicase PcrA